MKKSFRVSTSSSGRKRVVRVVVYESADELRRAAERYSKLIGSSDASFEGTVGLAQTYDHYEVGKNGKERRLPGVGTIRLCTNHLGIGVVSHECAHVASSIYTQDCKNLGPVHRSMKNEEEFCYILGHLVSGVVAGLYRVGAYK